MPWNIRGFILNNPTDTLKCLNSNETTSRLAHSLTHALSLSLTRSLSLLFSVSLAFSTILPASRCWLIWKNVIRRFNVRAKKGGGNRERDWINVWAIFAIWWCFFLFSFLHHGFCYSDKQEDKVSLPRRENVFIVLFSELHQQSQQIAEARTAKGDGVSSQENLIACLSCPLSLISSVNRSLTGAHADWSGLL